MTKYWKNLPYGLQSAFVVLLWCLAILSWLYYWYPAERGHLLFFATFSGSFPVAFVAFHAARSFQLGVSRDKLHKSFEVLQSMNTREITETRFSLEDAIRNRPSGTDLYTFITNNSRLTQTTNQILGLFEDMAIAIKRDYLDEALLHRSLAAVVRILYRLLKPYVDSLRVFEQDPELYGDFEQLAIAWIRDESLVTGVPLDRASRSNWLSPRAADESLESSKGGT